MPQIVSLLPLAPALPGAAPAPSAALASTAVAAPGALLPTDPTSPNFLAQFKSALKTLANVVVPTQLTPRPVPDQSTGPLMSPVSDQPQAPSTADSDKKAEVSMPALLVELGFAVVPQASPMPATPTQPVFQSVAQTAATPASLLPLVTGVTPNLQPSGAVPVMQAAQPHAAPQLGQPVADARVATTQPNAALDQALADLQRSQASPDQQLSVASTDLLAGRTLAPASPEAAPAVAQLSPQPLLHLKPSDQPQVPTPTLTAQPAPATAADLAASVMLQPAPTAHQPATTASAGPAGLSVPLIGSQQQPSQGGSQSSTAGNDHGRPTPDKVVPMQSEASAVQPAPAPDAAMVAAAAALAPAAGPLPVQVGPSQVVSQIANHADLIRLPGNRGLHIQLHPDDLGGVQVTVRYSAGGGVELHINAEHAATGALVQAGWTELRDALAGHGISADRLVMSVTSPTAAGQADLSGGGGNRSDPNANSSNPSTIAGQSLGSADGQGQGQGRQDDAQQRSSQTWRGGVEPISSSDDSPRVASTSAAPSRIDYRV